ncbi:MAG: hypothetical protein V4629_07490 [Pseudomonadota bacterium]
MFKEKLIKIERLDLRAELFGDLKNEGIDLTVLLNRIVQNVNDLQNHQSDTQTKTLVFQENISQVDLVLARIENLTIKNGRKIAQLKENSATQQQEVQLFKETVDQLQAELQQIRKASTNAAG